MKEQFSGDLKPNFIIPFKKDKKEAKEAYFKHLEGKFFLPKMFRDENHIDEIKGIYVPFWLYGTKVQMRATYNAQKKRVWKTNDTEYTERQYYNVQREGKRKQKQYKEQYAYNLLTDEAWRKRRQILATKNIIQKS